MRWPAVVLPLRDRDFRLLWTGQTLSSFGNSVRGVALPFQLFALGASPLELGIAAALNTTASVVFLLLGGAVADRASRRTLIVASDLVGGCAVAALALLAASGQLRIPHVYVAAIALGVADAFLAPAYSAIVAELVPRDVLRAGNAVRLLGRSVARIAGPAAGGVLVALVGPALGFAVDAFTFFFSFATLLLVAPSRRAASARAPILREIRDGFGHFASVRWLWTTTLYFMLVNVAYAGHGSVLMPLLVRDRLGGGPTTLGTITMAYGAGTIVASVVIAQLVRDRPGRVLFGFEVLAGISALGMGLVPIAPVVAVLMAVTGAALASSTVLWQALLQHDVPDAMLGRVSSLDLLGNSLINPVGPLVAAALASAFGPANALAVAGAYATLFAAVALVASPLARSGTPDQGLTSSSYMSGRRSR